MAAPMNRPGPGLLMVILTAWGAICVAVMAMALTNPTGPTPTHTTRPTSTEAPIHPTTDKTGLIITQNQDCYQWHGQTCGPGGNRR